MDMETTTNTTFSPVESTLTGVSVYCEDFLNSKLAKVNKRLAKLGAPAATLTFGPIVERTEKNEFGFDRTFREFEFVTVTGVEAKFSGWTGIATLDHTLDPNEALVSKFPGEEETPFPEEYRFKGAWCDHCNKIRSRNMTVLFLHEDGRWMTVGTSCILDFIGVDPKNVVWLAAPLIGGSDDEDEMRSYGGRWEITPHEFLAAAAEATRLFGFVKSRPDTSYDTPTRSHASTLCNGRLNEYEKKLYRDVDFRKGSDEADKIMAWVAADTGWSDYMRSASLACRTFKVTDKTEGLLASLPFSYMKAMGKLAERAAAATAKPTDFLGTVGTKITVEGTVTFKMAFEPYAWNGPTPYRLTIVTDEGYTLTTKGSGNTLWEAEVGDRITWTGKVTGHEDHETYGKRTECKLVKITVLERPEEEAPPAPAPAPFEAPLPLPAYDPHLEVSYDGTIEVLLERSTPYSAKIATSLVNWVWITTDLTA
jgi:hypothetical protein